MTSSSRNASRPPAESDSGDPLAFAAAELEALGRSDLRRFLRIVDGAQGAEIQVGARRVLCLCSNNYLGLAGDPRLARAAIDGIERCGLGAGASRLISGNARSHEDLERELAAFKGTEAALVFNSGFHANLGAIPALVGRGDLILSDELNHASLIDGARLSRAEVRVFRHGDVEDASRALGDRGRFRRALIVTDSVYSMDGDLAPLPDLLALARAADALLYVDEAHATGVLGASGRGAVEHFGLADPRPDRRLVQMGTLGKALGGFGAYVASTRNVIDLFVNRARSFVFTTGLPPALMEASRAALAIVRGEPERRVRLGALTARLRSGLEELGYRVGGESAVPIVPVRIGDAARTMKLAEALFERGVLATGIRPPTVPAGTSRIRATVVATMTDEHVDHAIESFAEAGREIGVIV